MIFIGLDVSKISTALVLENNINNNTKIFSYTTKKENNIWVKNTNNFINYRHVNYDYIKTENYSDKELIKLNEFDTITDLIIDDIFDNIKISNGVRIAIEGYSYNSKGPIFDLIEFTTVLKHKLLKKINTYTNITIKSPLTLKTEACKIVYKPRIELKGKKIIKEIIHYENTKGKEATKFDKWDMMYAFIDSDIKSELKDWCKEYIEQISKNKDIPKPLDDVIDAYFLKEIIKTGEGK